MLQFLNTEGNFLRTEAFMGFKIGTLSSARIIQDVDLALKALEIVYRENGGAVEGLADRNGHSRKVVGKGKVSDVEVHGTKVRVASANSPKRCSTTVIC